MKYLALVLLVAACGDDGAVKPPDAAEAADANLTVDAAPPRETITAAQLLEPGEFVEGIMTGGPADLAQMHFEAPSAEIDWKAAVRDRRIRHVACERRRKANSGASMANIAPRIA